MGETTRGMGTVYDSAAPVTSDSPKIWFVRVGENVNWEKKCKLIENT